MNEIIIVAPNRHLIFNMTVLNQTDYATRAMIMNDGIILRSIYIVNFLFERFDS
jgi:hypothetical protein